MSACNSQERYFHNLRRLYILFFENPDKLFTMNELCSKIYTPNTHQYKIRPAMVLLEYFDLIEKDTSKGTKKWKLKKK